MATQRPQLQAAQRTLTGRKVNTLRKVGQIPAHVYGSGVESLSLTLDTKVFLKLYSQAGETTLVDLQVDGESNVRPVLITVVDRHPVTNALIHVDFRQVDLKEKVSANIPIEVVGESEAVKAGAVLFIAYNELEVEALPTDLPEQFTIDINPLNVVGDELTVASLVYDRRAITLSLPQETVIATVKAQAVEEEPVAVSTEPAEVELIKQGATKAEEEPVASGEVGKTPKSE